MAYLVLKSCTRCGACLPECPTGSIIAGKDHYVIDSDTCADHAACVSVCPVDAIVPLSPLPGLRPATGDGSDEHDDEEEEEEE